MARNVGNFFLAVVFSAVLWGCAGEFSEDEALYKLQGLEEFTEYFSAPLHIGDEILTEANHSEPMGYALGKYGVLVDEGLLEVEVGKANSWRTVLRVSLSDEGRRYYNEQRTESYRALSGADDVYFVEVCHLVPERVVSVRALDEDRVEVDYIIVERDITPFGEFLEYSAGNEHTHSRTFERGIFGWNLVFND
ncbi:MAG: hypothetical protein R3Y61_03120 [Rikenellaceae bacterium]